MAFKFVRQTSTEGTEIFEDTMFDVDSEEVGVEKSDEETAEFLFSAVSVAAVD